MITKDSLKKEELKKQNMKKIIFEKARTLINLV